MLGVIVDDLLSAESQQEVAVAAGRGCQDMGAAHAGELNRQDAYRPRATVNEHALARLQLGPIKQALPGCQRVDRNGRRLDMGLREQNSAVAPWHTNRSCRILLSDGAVGPGADGGDGARKLVARDSMAAVFARFGVRGRLPQ